MIKRVIMWGLLGILMLAQMGITILPAISDNPF